MAKRVVDIIVALVLIPVVLPVIAVLGIATAISLREWPFFCQQRVGRNGRMFRFLKVRTLPSRTPAYVSKYALRPESLPRLSRWLRSRHLDELPQLLLVVSGRMSLVGPRPEMLMLHEQMAPSFAEARVAVRPGCTGLWQIGSDAHRLIAESPEYDIYYLRHAGVRLDLWILWRSIRVMLFGGPKVALQDVPRRFSTTREPLAPSMTPTGSDGRNTDGRLEHTTPVPNGRPSSDEGLPRGERVPVAMGPSKSPRVGT